MIHIESPDKLQRARGIVYGHLVKVFPDVTMDADRLDGEAYTGIWDSQHQGGKMLTVCNAVFSGGSDIAVYYLPFPEEVQRGVALVQ